MDPKRRALLDQMASAAAAKTATTIEENNKRRMEREQRQSNLASKGSPKIRSFADKLWLKVWKPGFNRIFPEVECPKWGPKEYGQLRKMLERQDNDRSKVELAVRYVIDNWESLHEEWFKGKELSIPTVGFILKFDSTLVPKAQLAKNRGTGTVPSTKTAQQKLREAEAALDKWFDENPGAYEPPKELRQAVAEAKSAL